MLGSHEPVPEGWEVRVHASVMQPVMVLGLPRKTAIYLGTCAVAIGLHITIKVVPLVLIVWIALAQWTKHDPDGLGILRRFWQQKRHYYG